jgi:DNA polymerase-1
MYKPARMGNGIEIWGISELEKFEIRKTWAGYWLLGMMGDAATTYQDYQVWEKNS